MIDLDDLKSLATGDPSGMLMVLKEFSAQCHRALAAADHLPDIPAERYCRFLVCGMGGSAIAGDILRIFVAGPAEVHRDYGLPPWTDAQTLLLAVSYSGNTEETLSAVKAALAQGLRPICLSSGGRLGGLARQSGLSYIEIPVGLLAPRAAFAYLTLPLLALMARSGLVRAPIESERAITELSKISSQLGPDSSEAGNLAKKLAKALYGRIPLIWGTSGAGEVIARRWKTQLNENAKQPAFYGAIPELCHNEIVPLARLREALPGSVVVLLRDADERPENHRRVEILKEMLEEHDLPFEEILPWGKSRLGQLLAQVHLGDYVSVYLALLNHVDPTPVEPIERFKARMKP
jgi:glucose/mannose-6-phosphate isomerase